MLRRHGWLGRRRNRPPIRRAGLLLPLPASPALQPAKLAPCCFPFLLPRMLCSVLLYNKWLSHGLHCRVTFRVVVFRPFREELLVGRVHRMTK